MPRHLESMRDEVERHARASFFSLHNLAADRWCQSMPGMALSCACVCTFTKPRGCANWTVADQVHMLTL